ncbi:MULTISPECIES: hypothetical protein [unclassified Rhizobium]|uniref:hypothetical protein n=1 Tax=unclassified Rhizobium TaxID=2613769 RepID=UPI001ADA9DF2|nr:MULTISPECIES: hypothetical protein [unclassified Rhizobium]MBO9099503.1 hypothetical protein [Rhizobium sp. L58/93]QXZ87015.1 hypothetical protein J5287_20710 [Rhizobium sp. K1/93]QXZ92951.1 hypothetical protein J5280_20185 [Rhizobium sp. K15/93]
MRPDRWRPAAAAQRLPFFEKVVSAIHHGAPKAAIVFTARLQDTAEAGFRLIGADGAQDHVVDLTG